MDFEDTPEEAAFRKQVREWLATNAPRRGESVAGDELADRTDKAFLTAAKAWQARKAEAGYARITWPKEVGGYGGTPIQQVIFNQEEGKIKSLDGLGGAFRDRFGDVHSHGHDLLRQGRACALRQARPSWPGNLVPAVFRASWRI